MNLLAGNCCSCSRVTASLSLFFALLGLLPVSPSLSSLPPTCTRRTSSSPSNVRAEADASSRWHSADLGASLRASWFFPPSSSRQPGSHFSPIPAQKGLVASLLETRNNFDTASLYGCAMWQGFPWCGIYSSSNTSRVSGLRVVTVVFVKERPSVGRIKSLLGKWKFCRCFAPPKILLLLVVIWWLVQEGNCVARSDSLGFFWVITTKPAF